jgi:hypothetical protein
MSVNIKTITNAFTNKINNLDFVDASHINNLQQAVKQLAGCTLSQAGYVNSENLSMPRLLTDDDMTYQLFISSGVNQIVQLPPISSENHPFVIWNFDEAKNITVNDGDGNFLLTLYPKDYVLLVQMGGLWLSFKGGDDPSFNFQVVIGDGISPITTGVKGDFEVPYNCEVVGWTIIESTGNPGTLVVDIWRDSYSSFPPTVSDSICGTEKPTTPGITRGKDDTLMTWYTRLYKGDILRYNVESTTGQPRQITVCLKCKRV